MAEREKITLLSKKDLNISYFVGPGDGGQNKQKTSSGVMLVHKASGAIGRASDTRSQEQNKKLAFRRLNEHPKMKVWIAAKIYEIRMGETLEERVNKEVDKMMADENIQIEVKDEEGKWVPA